MISTILAIITVHTSDGLEKNRVCLGSGTGTFESDSNWTQGAEITPEDPDHVEDPPESGHDYK